MEKTIKKGRNSSIELLRIVALVFIFWMHAAGSYQDNNISAWGDIAISVVGNIGVSCFILISGYYGIRLQAKKMMQLECMILFYSWAALILQTVWGVRPGGEELLSYLLPVIGKRSWYFTCYFALAFLSPFLNEMTEKLSEIRLRQLLAVMLLVFSGVTTFFFFDINGDGGKGVVHMIMLYLIGRYIGMYRKEKKYQTGKLIGLFAVVSIVNFCLNGALYIATGTVQNRFARDNTLFTIAEAVLVFLIFKNIHFENQLVNKMARHVPAVFLFEWTLRSIMTMYLFDYQKYAAKNYYDVILFAVAVTLVILGSVIDWLRITVLHRPEKWIVDHCYGAGTKVFARIRAKAGL